MLLSSSSSVPRFLLNNVCVRRGLATSSSPFQSIGCVGLGLMGHGIAQTAANFYPVVAYEPKQEYLDTGKSRIETSLSKLVKRGKLTTEQSDKLMSNITFTTNLDDLKNTDLIVEAVIEKLDLKKDLYENLGQLCDPKTVFASNTSSLKISDMAAFSGRADRFVGIHFFNPVQVMKLVEVIQTDRTDPQVFEDVYHWVESIKKVPVRCGDTPGFIVNRLLVPSLLQAMLLVERGDASIRDTDLSMQLGAGHPMGPLQLVSAAPSADPSAQP